MKSKIHNLNRNQSGIVAFTVTLIMIIVIAMITIAMAQISRREQRQVLDKELSSQAYYAAESGINDTKNAIINHGFNVSNDQCSGYHPGLIGPTHISTSSDLSFLLSSNALSAALRDDLGGISASSGYSCILIDQRPTSLQYGSIDLDHVAFADLKTFDPVTKLSTPLSKLNISWQNTQNGLFRSITDPLIFPPVDKWLDTTGVNTATGVLRVDITAFDGNPASNYGLPANFNYQDLNKQTMTLYLYPREGSGVANIVDFDPSASNTGQVISGKCNVADFPRFCNVLVSFTARPGLAPAHIFVRLSSIYRSSSVTVQALSGGTLLSIDGGQEKVDVTGKSADVVRRLQARISTQPSFALSNNAVDESSSICKLYEVAPGSTQSHC